MKRVVFVIVGLALFAILWPSSMRVAVATLPDGTSITVEIARSPSQKTRGLAGRPSLGATEGMLFAYRLPQIVTMWMKDMRFPIDIVWLRDERIVYLVADALPNDSPTRTRYSSSVLADRVLELPAGSINSHSLFIDDRIVITGDY